MNRIVKITVSLHEAGWLVEVTKEFAPENGGGSHVFQEWGGHQIHRALDVAREMVTVSPGQNPGADPPFSYDYDELGNPKRGRLGE